MSAVPPTIPADANVTSLQSTKVNLVKGALTIAAIVDTDIADAGTVNAASGKITFTSATTTTATETEATITNSFCSATSVLLVSIDSYAGVAGTDGVPTVHATAAEGNFILTVVNESVTAAALLGTLVVSFLIV
jgi:roadblock/LC7 domain-containing protein